MSSSSAASLNRTHPQNLDDGDKEKAFRIFSPERVKPELAVHPEVSMASCLNSKENEWAAGFKLFNIITAVALVCLLMLLDTSIVSTVSWCRDIGLRLPAHHKTQAIPRITSEFHSLADVGWYGSSYQLARSGSIPKLSLFVD